MVLIVQIFKTNLTDKNPGNQKKEERQVRSSQWHVKDMCKNSTVSFIAKGRRHSPGDAFISVVEYISVVFHEPVGSKIG